MATLALALAFPVLLLLVAIVAYSRGKGAEKRRTQLESKKNESKAHEHRADLAGADPVDVVGRLRHKGGHLQAVPSKAPSTPTGK